MPFSSTGAATIGTYNDVGRDQRNNNTRACTSSLIRYVPPKNNVASIDTYNEVGRDQHNSFHGSIVNIYSTSTSLTSRTHKYGLPFALPTIEPYRTFNDTIIEIQDAIEPLVRIMDTMPLKDLVGELSDVLMTISLAGRLLELMEQTELKGLVWHRRISDRVGRWIKVFRPVIEEVRQYREGLKFTLIGPIWRRVLWSVIWQLSSDSDIASIVSKCQCDLAVFKQPVSRLLAAHRIYMNSFYRDHWLPDTRHLLDLLCTHAPLERPLGSYCTITTIDFEGDSITFPFDLFATHQDLCTMLNTLPFEYFSGVGWVDKSDHQVMSPKKLARLRSQPSATIVLEPFNSIGPFVCYEDRDDICPACHHIAKPTPLWMECGSCEMRFRTETTGVEWTCSEFRWPQINSKHLSDDYVVVKRLNPLWSRLSTITNICNLSCSASNFLFLLRHLVEINAPMTSCSVTITPREAILIPSYLDHPRNESSILLHYLRCLTIINRHSDNALDILDHLHMPQLTQFCLDHSPPGWQYVQTNLSPTLGFFLQHGTLEAVDIHLPSWGFSQTRQLMLSLPRLRTFKQRCVMLVIKASDPDLHSLVDLTEDETWLDGHPLREIEMLCQTILGDASWLPDAWQIFIHRRSGIISNTTHLLHWDRRP